MNSREQFEAHYDGWSESPSGFAHSCRMGDSYAAPNISRAWVHWQASRAALVVELPDYHHQAMGCGLEDRGITDRYEACRHGFECALERVGGAIEDAGVTVSQ